MKPPPILGFITGAVMVIVTATVAAATGITATHALSWIIPLAVQPQHQYRNLPPLT